MTNSNDGAFGMAGEGGYQIGLTKRELFAAMAMQGMLSADRKSTSEQYAVFAVVYADALIAALSEPPEATP